MTNVTVIFILIAFAGQGIGIVPNVVISQTKNKTDLFTEDVNKIDAHWPLVLRKIGTQVKLETTLICCNTCTTLDADLPLTITVKVLRLFLKISVLVGVRIVILDLEG